jgi:hypothetical protein
MSTFLLKTIDPDTWAKVKARAALDRTNLRRLFYWWLDIYARKGLSVFEQAAGEKLPASAIQQGRPPKNGKPVEPVEP